MFHFAGSRDVPAMDSQELEQVLLAQVTPFGNLRVKACLPLSVAYRSLPRPSSPIGTKASMMRSL